MALISGLMPNCTAVIYPKLPFHIQRFSGSSRLKAEFGLVSKRGSRIRLQYFGREGSGKKYAPSVGRNHHELRFDDDLPEEPFWLTSTKEAIGALKSLFEFLAEQPGQLKYIEWPSFGSTLRTATLTLVLVAVLIVALSSVDAGLCYLLTLLLRKPV